ncbi:MAG TPA: flagellar biosynthetic protein FliO [Myxococcales bacterium]|jgi:flagellar biogenesis protein FliO|nr:flagellar biosynthetic protein FliO [Myxococcales bacterium]
MIILTALLAVQITAASAKRDNAELTVRIEADGAVDAAKVTTRLEARRLVLQVPATLDAQTRLFHADHRYIQAKREGEGVELEVPIGPKVSCSGAVSVVAIAQGLEAWVTCTEESAEAKANQTAPIVATIVSAEAANTPVAAKPAAVATLAEKPVEAAPVPAAKTATAKPAVLFETAAPAPQVDLLADSKKSTPLGAIAGALVVVLLGGAAYFLRNQKKRNTSRIEVLETAALGPKRSLVLARVGGKTLLLASSESGISMLETVGEFPQESTDPLEENEPAPQPAMLAKLRKFQQPKLASAAADPFSKLSKYLKPAEAAPQFDALFAEEQEDQELRMKLAAGYSARAR